MNKLILVIFALVLSSAVMAQKYIPQLGIGSSLNYTVEAVNMGYKVPLSLTSVSLNDPMKFKWTITGLGAGNFVIPQKALESGTKMVVRVPEPDQSTVYKDDETILFLSKSTLADMIKDQAFTVNKIKFIVKPLAAPYLINSKEADVLYATTDNGKVQLWILNNPNFPLICKMVGNPAGFDFDLTSFKE